MRYIFAAMFLASVNAQAMAPINERHLIAQSDPFPNGCKLACAVCPACKKITLPHRQEPVHAKPSR